MRYTQIGILVTLKKRVNSDNIDEPWGHYAKWNEPVTKGQILYNSTYMRYPEYSTSWRQKMELWLPELTGGGETGESLFNSMSFRYGVSVLQDEHSSGDGWWWWSYNPVNVLGCIRCMNSWLSRFPKKAGDRWSSLVNQEDLTWIQACCLISPLWVLPSYPLPPYFWSSLMHFTWFL